MITFMTGLFCPLKVIVYFRMTSDKICILREKKLNIHLSQEYNIFFLIHKYCVFSFSKDIFFIHLQSNLY